MNKTYFNIKNAIVATSLSFLMNAPILAETLQVSWSDSSSNEDGFIVEKRLLANGEFESISTLAANVSSYTDSDVILDETYCYRIIAYNQAGESPSEESCLAVIDESETDIITPKIPSKSTDPIYSYTDISIIHQFISKPTTIELDDKKFYSFKNDETYNEFYSDSSIYNTEFYVDNGQAKEYSRDYFVFQENGNDLVNGYTYMGFNSNNKLSFDMKSNGGKQVATLYMQAGVWTNETSSIVVTVGDTEQYITLPKGYSWQYISVDITFDGTVPITITTDKDQGGYSGLMFAGIVINDPVFIEEVDIEEPIQYASLLSVDTGVDTTIDVSSVEFTTYAMQKGNDEFSDASVESISYFGTNRTSSNTYKFITQNDVTHSGYKLMSWNEENGVTIKLESGESQINIVSLYFSAGAWSRETALIEVIINDQSEFIELSSGYSWKKMKVDIEFEGELNLSIRPSGILGGYSAFKFAGLTLY